jgi:hypothetical protein
MGLSLTTAIEECFSLWALPRANELAQVLLMLFTACITSVQEYGKMKGSSGEDAGLSSARRALIDKVASWMEATTAAKPCPSIKAGTDPCAYFRAQFLIELTEFQQKCAKIARQNRLAAEQATTPTSASQSMEEKLFERISTRVINATQKTITQALAGRGGRGATGGGRGAGGRDGGRTGGRTGGRGANNRATSGAPPLPETEGEG